MSVTMHLLTLYYGDDAVEKRLYSTREKGEEDGRLILLTKDIDHWTVEPVKFWH